MPDVQTCPRRMLEMGSWDRSEGSDEWLARPTQAGGAAPVCSFCGSLHPGRFLELVASGWSVGPTDKNYKAYLHPADPEDAVPPELGRTIPEVTHQVQSKFYYLHLSPTQQRQFIDLYNQGQMRISIPGHFYVLPFFMRIAPTGE